tara:strand:+ start:3162 stop:3557 length:396 start_codon:yes stop_codon:yes gene_type:complete
MPNWCENTLNVYGKKTPLSRFVKESKGDKTPLSLEKLNPLPEGREPAEWWGTKWDIDAMVEDYCALWIQYKFDSAWSPPREAVLAASKRFPTLEFTLRYEEPGMQFIGAFLCKGGNIYKDECIDYDFPSKL